LEIEHRRHLKRTISKADHGGSNAVGHRRGCREGGTEVDTQPISQAASLRREGNGDSEGAHGGRAHPQRTQSLMSPMCSPPPDDQPEELVIESNVY
jgi:hypothetical protein